MTPSAFLSITTVRDSLPALRRRLRVSSSSVPVVAYLTRCAS